jgi:putative endonuclease
MPGWVYIMTNRPNGTLYVRVTGDLARRTWEHRAGLVEGFTKQYGLTRLVFAEHYNDMRAARQRERNMKHWRRAWKVRLILDQNPSWADLYETGSPAEETGLRILTPFQERRRATVAVSYSLSDLGSLTNGLFRR